MDLQVFVPQIGLLDMRSDQAGESSQKVRERVIEARDRQRHRLARFGMRSNADMSPRVARATCPLDADAEKVLGRLFAVRVGMTGRGLDRLIRVARTLADLAGVDQITADHLLEAAGYRALDSLGAPDLRAARSPPPGAALEGASRG
jgi:magnesium chelatase family protein